MLTIFKERKTAYALFQNWVPIKNPANMRQFAGQEISRTSNQSVWKLPVADEMWFSSDYHYFNYEEKPKTEQEVTVTVPAIWGPETKKREKHFQLPFEWFDTTKDEKTLTLDNGVEFTFVYNCEDTYVDIVGYIISDQNGTDATLISVSPVIILEDPSQGETKTTITYSITSTEQVIIEPEKTYTYLKKDGGITASIFDFEIKNNYIILTERKLGLIVDYSNAKLERTYRQFPNDKVSSLTPKTIILNGYQRVNDRDTVTDRGLIIPSDNITNDEWLTPRDFVNYASRYTGFSITPEAEAELATFTYLAVPAVFKKLYYGKVTDYVIAYSTSNNHSWSSPKIEYIGPAPSPVTTSRYLYYSLVALSPELAITKNGKVLTLATVDDINGNYVIKDKELFDFSQSNKNWNDYVSPSNYGQVLSQLATGALRSALTLNATPLLISGVQSITSLIPDARMKAEPIINDDLVCTVTEWFTWDKLGTGSNRVTEGNTERIIYVF